jgi:histidyl-tRNA synthetase
VTDFSPPRGTKDYLPPESEQLEDLARLAAFVAGSFGFRRIETPALEHTDLFVRGVGETSDVVTKEMYTFEDQGGRSLTLRPEGTAPVMRAYLNKRQELPLPFKAYYVVPMFRHERPQAGRMRQHTQFGVETIGTDAPLADVEVIAVGHRFFTGGMYPLFDSVRLLLNSIGDEACRPAFREALVAFLEERTDRLRDEHRERWRVNPLRVLDCKDPTCREVTEDAPTTLDFLCEECRAHFEAVQAGLKEEGIEFEIDHRLVRGLDYYTRTAFEFVSEVLGPTQSTLCGGGRYDGLAAALGGPSTAGVGFGLGFERVLLAVEREGRPLPDGDQWGKSGVFVVAMGSEARVAARALLRELRGRGYRADAALEDRPLKAQLKMADRAGLPYAVIIGEEELRHGVVTFRDMQKGTQESMTQEDLVSWLMR